MGFNSYASFRSVVGSWADTDVTVTSLDQAIKMGENYVHRKLRIEAMETALAVTINALGTATLPADYMEAQYLYLNRSPRRALTKKPAEWIIRNYPTATATGIPSFVAETNSTFIFGPPASTQDTVVGTYYAKPASLPGTGTINSVFSEAPEIYLWAALANAEVFLGRDQRMIWQQKCDEAINSTNNEAKRRRFSGGPISASPG